ncbi:Uncharacterised protein [Candidatus Tiddalikarchaeum anstoanum]|nr:Uncharacterised protein [Candidatus Tiddalikarchaeum anstoanum]
MSKIAMNQTAQIDLGNFLTAVIFLFMLASAVFLFLGNNVASQNIDFFNRTIYSQQLSGLDVVYITTYREGNIFNVDPTKYSVINSTTGYQFNYGFKRTSIPPSADARISVTPYMTYEKCGASPSSCTKERINGLEVLAQRLYSYPVTLPRTIGSGSNTYPEILLLPFFNCTSEITLGAGIASSIFNESVVDNNEYSFNASFCFYPPTDPSIGNMCMNGMFDSNAPCTINRSWDHTIVCNNEVCGEECTQTPIYANVCNGTICGYEQGCCNKPSPSPPENPYYVCDWYCLPWIPTTCCWGHYETRYTYYCTTPPCDNGPSKCCNTTIGYNETCTDLYCEVCNERGTNQPLESWFNPNLLRIDLANKYNDVSMKLKFEITDSLGAYHEIGFDKMIIQTAALPSYNSFNVGAFSNFSALVDLSQAHRMRNGLMAEAADLYDCSEGKMRVSIEYDYDNSITYLINSSSMPVYEYDTNHHIIRTTDAEHFVVYQSPVQDFNVYASDGSRLVFNVVEGGVVTTVSPTHNFEDALIRPIDKITPLWFEGTVLKGFEGLNCNPVSVGTDTCYCPRESSTTNFACSTGSFTGFALQSGTCAIPKVVYDVTYHLDARDEVITNYNSTTGQNDTSTLHYDAVTETTNDMDNCITLPNYTCVARFSSQICSGCETTTTTRYLFCNSELVPKKVIEKYNSEIVIKDADISNNQVEKTIYWCVR